MQNFNVEYYTDPVCCWSWGMEPQFRKLRYLFREKLNISYYMGGLISDWSRYADPINEINRPSQMGPLWMEAKHVTGQPINEFIWIENPIDSSYPACLAVKAAQSQSFIAGEAMLRELREAVFLWKENISETKIILQIAKALAKNKILDLELFQKELYSQETSDLFRKDLEQIRIKRITRFPTLLISNGERTLQITGYRPFDVLLDAFQNLDPELKLNEDIDPEEYQKNWVNLTNRELEEIGMKRNKNNSGIKYSGKETDKVQETK